MAKFALIIDDAFVEVRGYPEQPVDVPHKNVRWLPYVEVTDDQSTTKYKVQNVTKNVVEADRVVTTITITDEPQSTIDQIEDERKERAIDRALAGSEFDRAVGKTLLELANRVLVLEGKQPLTVDQFRAFFKSKMS